MKAGGSVQPGLHIQRPSLKARVPKKSHMHAKVYKYFHILCDCHLRNKTMSVQAEQYGSLMTCPRFFFFLLRPPLHSLLCSHSRGSLFMPLLWHLAHSNLEDKLFWDSDHLPHKIDNSRRPRLEFSSAIAPGTMPSKWQGLGSRSLMLPLTAAQRLPGLHSQRP